MTQGAALSENLQVIYKLYQYKLFTQPLLWYKIHIVNIHQWNESIDQNSKLSDEFLIPNYHTIFLSTDPGSSGTRTTSIEDIEDLSRAPSRLENDSFVKHTDTHEPNREELIKAYCWSTSTQRYKDLTL